MAATPSTWARRALHTGPPTDDEARAAHAVLGVRIGATQADVKKKYMELAKLHHPDVLRSSGGAAATGAPPSSASGDEKMVAINNAYSALTRFFKAGRVLSDGSGPSRHPKTAPSGHSAFGNDDAYSPLWEDLHPIMHEMMWEEMRRQAEEEAANHTRPPFYGSGGGGGGGFAPFADGAYGYEPRGHSFRRARPRHAKVRGGGGGGAKQSGGGVGSGGREAAGTGSGTGTAWPEEDRKALANMYDAGKSFDFIANALGKPQSDVVAEFNRWQAEGKQHRRQWKPSRGRGHRHRGYGPGQEGMGAFYYCESPDTAGGVWVDLDDDDVGIGMDDGGGDDDDDEPDWDEFYSHPEDAARHGGAPYGFAQPYDGRHHMHRGGGGRGGSRRHHRGRDVHRSGSHHRGGGHSSFVGKPKKNPAHPSGTL